MFEIKIKEDEFEEICDTLEQEDIEWDRKNKNTLLIKDEDIENAGNLLNDEGYEFEIL